MGRWVVLDYMHARYYNPGLGRFLSVDPIGGNPHLPQSWNRYAYVLNNPLNYIDPEGLAAIDSCTRSGSSVSCKGSITVPAELEDPEAKAPYDPLTGVQGLQDLQQGAAFFNSGRGAPEGYGYGGVRLSDALAAAPGVPCTGGYTCEILRSFREDLPVLHAMEVGVVAVSGAAVAVEAGAVEVAIAGGRAVIVGGRAAASAGTEAVGAAGVLVRGTAQRTVNSLFGRGGLLNSNRYLRIGESSHRGHKYFSIRGQILDRITGSKRAHIDLWRIGGR